MVEVREREVITPVSDGGAGAAAMVILGLILVAVIGYMIYAFNGHPSSVIERDTNTTIQTPAPAPAPAAPVMPAAPSGSVDSSSSSDSSAQ